MSETTTIHCAHCGGENKVSNAEHEKEEAGKTLKLIKVFDKYKIIFVCQHCEVAYPLTNGNQ